MIIFVLIVEEFYLRGEKMYYYELPLLSMDLFELFMTILFFAVNISFILLSVRSFRGNEMYYQGFVIAGVISMIVGIVLLFTPAPINVLDSHPNAMALQLLYTNDHYTRTIIQMIAFLPFGIVCTVIGLKKTEEYHKPLMYAGFLLIGYSVLSILANYGIMSMANSNDPNLGVALMRGALLGVFGPLSAFLASIGFILLIYYGYENKSYLYCIGGVFLIIENAFMFYQYVVFSTI